MKNCGLARPPFLFETSHISAEFRGRIDRRLTGHPLLDANRCLTVFAIVPIKMNSPGAYCRSRLVRFYGKAAQ